MSSYELTPKVDETQEFIEIANDFSNPLDLVREAISNAFDAEASELRIQFDTLQEYGKHILRIKISDDGIGMDKKGLQSFFDLGNSLSRDKEESIGEKGHGTKVYFNSSHIEVNTSRGNIAYNAKMDAPYRKLHDRKIPKVEVDEDETTEASGTEIIIKGYNNNERKKFTHNILKDYILWFTKVGSFENIFYPQRYNNFTLYLKGLDVEEEEPIEFGHPFPAESRDIQKLFDEYLVRAPDHYCRRIVKNGSIEDLPDIKFQAVFSIEGNRVKQKNNPMVRRRGYNAPQGAYTVQDRYGIWISKDFIPVQRKNEWISVRGSEYTKFHAIINCQDLRLTANRGSIDNTPTEILSALKQTIVNIYNDIISGDDWRNIMWLEDEAEGFQTEEKEKSDFKWRKKKIKKANIAIYKNVTFVEPNRESGVYSLFIQLDLLEPELFPFQVIEYDTYSGIDVIAKGDKDMPIQSSKLFYIEFKHYLTKKGFNHSFENIYSIICWDTDVKHDDTIEGLTEKEERIMKISEPEGENDYTRYFLEHPKKAHRIEVYVLKDYLKEKLNLEFRPRKQSNK
jgi:hypothetical protein